MNFNDYQTFVFDCDGVVLNSNDVKTDAFYKSVLPYGTQAAQSFVSYHVENGGVSRYKKFEYFLTSIAPRANGPSFAELLELYSNEVVNGLLKCEIAPGLDDLKDKTASARWLIVSGGDEQELRFVFRKRRLYRYFEGGVFGSPTSKKEILDREIENENINGSTLFLGDSKYDYESAQYANLDFIFLSSWSEIKDWPKWSSEKGISVFESIDDIARNGYFNKD